MMLRMLPRIATRRAPVTLATHLLRPLVSHLPAKRSNYLRASPARLPLPSFSSCVRSLHTTHTCFSSELTESQFHLVADPVLDHLTEAFEDIADNSNADVDIDVTFGNGVLTVAIEQHGTYVINKQTPNRQIWLSSPVSGPKRYDRNENGDWVYSHDNISLHTRLSEEISELLQIEIDFEP
eukprot:m.40274 g.40274  ORF g.40274 m.40274 type:complete len:181 (+) comp16728_c0_seq4:1057-1599(+)